MIDASPVDGYESARRSFPPVSSGECVLAKDVALAVHAILPEASC